MKYRGLFWNEVISDYEWVYGLPAYKENSDNISVIQSQNGRLFYDIIPETLGEETEYKDKNRKQIYTGDILRREFNKEVQDFIVTKTTVDQEYSIIRESISDGIRARLAGVIVLERILPNGETSLYLPCINHLGIDDCRNMKIIGTIYDKKIEKNKLTK